MKIAKWSVFILFVLTIAFLIFNSIFFLSSNKGLFASSNPVDIYYNYTSYSSLTPEQFAKYNQYLESIGNITCTGYAVNVNGDFTIQNVSFTGNHKLSNPQQYNMILVSTNINVGGWRAGTAIMSMIVCIIGGIIGSVVIGTWASLDN